MNKTVYQQALQDGQSFNAEKQWTKAMVALRKVIRIAPNEPLAYAALGEACLGMKWNKRALNCYKLAAKYSRGDFRYLSKVADVQERLGQLREAGKTYLAAGEMALRSGDVETAVDNWLRAVQIEPNQLGAHKRLAVTFERQGLIREAVREYLALARVLQARGKSQQALDMCQAAMQLDPGNEDAQTAVRLILYGEKAFNVEIKPEPEAKPEPEPEARPEAEPEPELDDSEMDISEALRQMAGILEVESAGWRKRQEVNDPDNPVSKARQLAQEELANEIFREESAGAASSAKMNKLERDALIGQGMDFEWRGQMNEAIQCYEKAVAGGLTLPAAYFTIGLLYLDIGQPQKARQSFAVAAQVPSYRKAAERALKG